jgi:AraC family transcriptional regulator, regulatory protein of adaptative response / methylated-DNA-[protein]-cysteine methyltransferase
MVRQNMTNPKPIDQDERWHAVLRRDRSTDGLFFYAVKSTGVYCRPSCPSRRPKRESVEFFEQPADAERAGYRSCLRCLPKQPDPQSQWIAECCRLLERDPDRTVSLAELAAHAGISAFHLQRTFKQHLGMTPREYQDALRMKRVKVSLTNGQSITDAIYDAGFNSISRFYEKATEHLGMSPFTYKRGGPGQAIRFTVFPSSLGSALIATTDQGVCSVAFGDDEPALERSLRSQFSQAVIVRDDSGLQNHAEALKSYLAGRRMSLDLPLDIRATAFQERVWKLLAAIPYGDTRTYSQIAQQLGQPTAARAVARACATNAVAVLIPCHRVVGKGGEISGYRWGSERKRRLLETERRQSAKAR